MPFKLLFLFYFHQGLAIEEDDTGFLEAIKGGRAGFLTLGAGVFTTTRS